MAMMSLMLFSLNWQQLSLVSMTNQMRLEIASIAGGVANEEFEALSVQPFDSLITFDGAMRTHRIVLEQDTLDYEITNAVQYVEKQAGTFVPSALPTDLKEVTLNIDGILDTGVSISRIFNRNAE